MSLLQQSITKGKLNSAPLSAQGAWRGIDREMLADRYVMDCRYKAMLEEAAEIDATIVIRRKSAPASPPANQSASGWTRRLLSTLFGEHEQAGK